MKDNTSFPYVVSIASMTLSILAIFGQEYNTNSILAATLGVVVTFLIGWNIYTIIDVRNLTKELRALTQENQNINNDIAEKLKKNEAEIRSKFTEELIQTINMLSSLEGQDITVRLSTYFRYFGKTYKSESIAMQLITYDRILTIISKAIEQDISEAFINEVAKNVDERDVSLFYEAYGIKEKKYDQIKSWLNELLELRHKKTV